MARLVLNQVQEVDFVIIGDGEEALLGLVEGITEFLPISSTAHLIITSKILQLQQTEFLKLFEVFIQSGAILSVVFLYFNYHAFISRINNFCFFNMTISAECPAVR